MIYRCILLTVVFLSSFSLCPAQEPAQPEQPVRVVIEEVQLNVTAQNGYGHFDPTVTKDDLLVVENGVPQNISGLRRVPASVLLLLDTGGALYFAKSSNTTRAAAKSVAENLPPDAAVAVMQYNDKPEIISDWTTTRKETATALTNRLWSGKRSRFAAAINAAVEIFKSRPNENRHLVLISDGLESTAAAAEQQQAQQNLLAANVTVHAISYTQLEQQQTQQLTERGKFARWKNFAVMLAEFVSPDIRTARHRERVAAKTRSDGALTNAEIKGNLSKTEAVYDSPHDETDKDRQSVGENAQDIFTIKTDNDWIALVRARQEAWKMSEARLKTVAEETGGVFHAPESLTAMQSFGREIAAAINAQYVVNYVPKRSFAESKKGEMRTVRVASRRFGLQVMARQKIVAVK